MLGYLARTSDSTLEVGGHRRSHRDSLGSFMLLTFDPWFARFVASVEEDQTRSYGYTHPLHVGDSLSPPCDLYCTIDLHV